MTDERLTESVRKEITSIKVNFAKGISALKVMIDSTTGRTERVEKKSDELLAALSTLRERVSTLEERINNVKQDVTGSHTLYAHVAKTQGKEEATKEIKNEEKTEKQLAVEKWKASAPIYVAIIAAFGALATGIINMILHFAGGGSGH